MKRSPIKRRGKKTKAWESVRAWLKKEFERRGITFCEFGFKNCWRNNALGFAHSRKRDHSAFDIYEVALACNPCHDQLDVRSSQEKMYGLVMTAIENHGGVIRPDA